MNKLFVVCFLALLSVSLGARTSSSKNIRSQIFSLLETKGYTINQVLELLESLKATEIKDLEDLNANWEQTEPVLVQKIASDQ
mmetsp:Transcript_33346/g.30313  ORF Transcript_33346/g.30313 Transcript_33346/m.30313 type:complete len:83 (-) Transcript_33346:1309-1557(-)